MLQTPDTALKPNAHLKTVCCMPEFIEYKFWQAGAVCILINTSSKEGDIMREFILKLRSSFVSILLCSALIFTAFTSMNLIKDLQGNARVINYIGIVRGATQRLIKKELHHDPDDKLIKQLDDIIAGLSNGSDDLELIKLDDADFQSHLKEMQIDWGKIKVQIYTYRNGSSADALYNLSENYFELANDAVFKAEKYSEHIVQEAQSTLWILNIIFIISALGCSLVILLQEQRQKKLREAEHKNREKSEQLTRRAQDLLAPMNEISELMYVSDIETFDLLFVNEAGKRIFHIDDRQQNIKCYKVLQGFDKPCPFCTNKLLKADETYSWEYTNPILKKHYLLKDHLIEWEGRIARMEIAFDITKANDEKNELKRKVERDEIRLACVRELYNNRDIKTAMTKVLAHIGNLFSAERAYIFILHDKYYSNVAEWCREGISPEINNLQNIPLEDYQIWLDLFKTQKSIIINDVQELKDTFPTGYKLLSSQGIRNIIWVPLMMGEKIHGSLGLDNQDLNLAEAAVPFLQTIQYFLSLTLERNENEETLFELSQIDKLTSFYNRNRFIQDVAEFVKRNHSVGVIYLDINGLKEINDSFGHDAGDKLLKECAAIIKDASSSDYLYRIGGDEFVVIYLDITEEHYYDSAQVLKNAFYEKDFQIAIGCKWNASSSHIQTIIKEADELMYHDKKRFYQGHHTTSRYRHSNDVLSFLGNPDVLIEHIRKKHFKVFLQPKINVNKYSLSGAEALIRYQEEDGTIIPPDKFIPILEDTYFISKIDFYVFEEVCKTLSIWAALARPLVTISTNFSKISFMDDDFVKRIEAISNQYDIRREYLEIEITENTNDTDFDTLVERIHQIRAAGFKVAMDDFGIESSNLTLLSLTKFDVLKIDKSFVKDIVWNKRAQVILCTMSNMCKQMDIQLIAEGIENKQQLDIIKSFGIETIQGYFFSKPISIPEFEIIYMNQKSSD